MLWLTLAVGLVLGLPVGPTAPLPVLLATLGVSLLHVNWVAGMSPQDLATQVGFRLHDIALVFALVQLKTT
jgi:hypothetical protein